jgi:hypothetical protein
MALSILCLLILVCALPKDLKSREADKTIYREIGEWLAHREGNHREIRIVKSLRTPDWSAFYANLNYRGAPCPRTHFGMEPESFDEVVFKDYEVFIGYLKRNHIPYFLWEEKVWPIDGFDFLNQRKPDDLEKLGSWHHPDAGKIILYRVISWGPRGWPNQKPFAATGRTELLSAKSLLDLPQLDIAHKQGVG